MDFSDSANLDNLISAYFRRFTKDCEEDFWAFEEVDDLVRHEPEMAWKMILLLLQQAPSKKALSYVAAGPLEDLIKRHGFNFRERIIGEASRNKRLLYALMHVIIDDEEIDALPEKYGFSENDEIDAII
jgi:argininosuccinate lyase